MSVPRCLLTAVRGLQPSGTHDGRLKADSLTNSEPAEQQHRLYRGAEGPGSSGMAQSSRKQHQGVFHIYHVLH